MKMIIILLTATLSSSLFAEEITFNYSFQDLLKNVKDKDEITCPITSKDLESDKFNCKIELLKKYSTDVESKRNAVLGNRKEQNYILKEYESYFGDVAQNFDCAWTQTATTITCKSYRAMIINAVSKAQSVLKVNNLIHMLMVSGQP